MSQMRYTDEFKAEAVKQITERGYSVMEVSKRLGVSDKSLYAWLKHSHAGVQGTSGAGGKGMLLLKQELSRIKAELKRTAEERDILKKAAAYFANQHRRSTRS